MKITESIALSVVSGLLLTINSVQASESDAREASSLDTIVVTAARHPVERREIGGSTTIIDRTFIEARQARYVSDLLREIPGVSVTQSGGPGSQTQVRLRGSEANHTLVLIDGVRANDPASGDEFRWEFLTTGNIERIEVVRGPHSALWGSDALAGVVNIITRDLANTQSLDAYVEAGSNSSLNSGINGSTYGNGWALGGALEQLSTDGSNVSRSGSADDGASVLSAALNGKLRLSDNTSIQLGVRAVDADTDTDPADFVVTGLPTDGDLSSESSRVTAYLNGHVQPSDGWLSHQFGVRFLRADNDNLVAGIRDSSNNAKRLQYLYQADVTIQDSLLSLALEREETDFEQGGAVIFGDPNQQQRMTVSSLVADFTHRSGESATWRVGLRYDDNSAFDNIVTGQASLAWQLGGDTTLRASVGTGHKTPTFIERFGFFPQQFVGNPDLRPETSTAYEIGVERRLVDDQLRFELSLFQSDLNNEINGFVFDPVTFLSTAENRAGESRRRGVETSLVWQPRSELSLAANYSYVDATEESSGTRQREIRRPKHAANFSSTIDLFDDRASFTLVADYGGTRLDTFFAPFPAPQSIVTLDNYWLVDLAATVRLTESFDVFARVNNALDEDYEQVFGFNTPGRQAYIGIRAEFGR